jgi:hypothetical protein
MCKYTPTDILRYDEGKDKVDITDIAVQLNQNRKPLVQAELINASIYRWAPASALFAYLRLK